MTVDVDGTGTYFTAQDTLVFQGLTGLDAATMITNGELVLGYQ